MSIALLSQLLASVHPEPFVASLPTIVGVQSLQCHQQPPVQLSAMTCLATMVQQLGPRVLGELKRVMSIVLGKTKDGLSSGGDEGNPYAYIFIIISLIFTLIFNLKNFLSH